MSKTNVRVQLSNEDGNIFNLLGCTTRALKRAGYPSLAKELSDKVSSSKSYDEALQLIMSYVDVY